MITGVEDEGDIRTEERKGIYAGATHISTHSYTRIPESPPGKEIDLQQWDTLVFKEEHPDSENEHRGQQWTSGVRTSGVPGGHPRHDSRGRGTRRYQEGPRGQYRGKPDWRMDWTGGRTKKELFSGSDRWHHVGDSIVRNTDSRLSKEEDVVDCLPGARIEHVTERVEQIMGRGNGGSILVHIGTNNADKEGTTAILEKYRNLLKKTKQARIGHIILSGILPVFGNRIQ